VPTAEVQSGQPLIEKRLAAPIIASTGHLEHKIANASNNAQIALIQFAKAVAMISEAFSATMIVAGWMFAMAWPA